MVLLIQLQQLQLPIFTPVRAQAFFAPAMRFCLTNRECAL